MNRYVTLSIVLILILVLLVGCGKNIASGETTASMETVEDLFVVSTEQTQPNGDVTEADDTPDWPSGSLGIGFTSPQIDDVGKYYVYEGGEIHIDFYVQIVGNIGNDGIGLVLLLDGIPQPYRTADQEEYTYLHTFYPPREIGGLVNIELIFTPVIGKEGDTLLLEVFDLISPNYDPTVGIGGFRVTDGCLNSKAQLIFDTDPPEVEMPEVTERVAEWTLEMEDLTSTDIAGWSAESLQTKYSFQYSLDAAAGSNMYFGVTDETILQFHAEIFSPSAVQWALVLYIDNEPVSVQPENIIQFSTPSGQKAVIDIALDMAGYRESAPFYAVLVARNEWDSSVKFAGSSCHTEITQTCFFSREENLNVWLNKYHLD